MSDPYSEAFIKALDHVAESQRRGDYQVPLEEAIRRATMALLAAIDLPEVDAGEFERIADLAARGGAIDPPPTSPPGTAGHAAE